MTVNHKKAPIAENTQWRCVNNESVSSCMHSQRVKKTFRWW